MALFARVTLPYQDLSGVIQTLTKKCQKIIVYEHDADSGCNRTHCHILMENAAFGAEGAKKHIKTALKGQGIWKEDYKGNEFWSWTHDGKELVPAEGVKGVLTYMSKGTLTYKFKEGFSDQEVSEAKASWIERKSESNGKADKPKYDELDHLMKDWGPLDRKHITFEELRRWVFAWYWRRDGRIPAANQYKRMAGSLYLRIAEAHPDKNLQVAMDKVINLWY